MSVFFKSVKIYCITLVTSLKTSLKASVAITIIRILFMAISAFIPAINLLTIRKITDALIVTDTNRCLYWFFLLGIVQIFNAVISKIINYFTIIHSEQISFIISNDIINKINKLDISYFDDPKLYNETINVTRDVNSISQLVWNLLSVIQITIQFFTAFVIFFNYIWWAPFIIVLSCLPNFIFDRNYALKLYNWNRGTINEVRKMNYTYDTLISKYFSKDIRINRVKDNLHARYKMQWLNWFTSKRKILSKQFTASFLTMFLPNIITIFFAGYVIYNISKGDNTVGDFTYYLGIMGQITTTTFGIIAAISELIQQRIKVEYYYKFMDWKPLVYENPVPIKIKEFKSLQFKNVSFKYPNTEEYVLKGISFTINKGDKIGIVGKNGCGKSTIVKLLLRLYDVKEGEILLNGINITEFDFQDYYNIFSTMLQDYINYSFSLKDNVILADINRAEHKDEDIIKACVQSDSYSFVKNWEDGIYSYLTKSFDEHGKELSGGQWQKLALSRFFYKKAQFYILDEPSASLDIESEHIIFQSVFDKLNKNTLLLISHRLSNLKMMDKIIVLDNGIIAETGSHEELINKNGIYRYLYSMQYEKYC